MGRIVLLYAAAIVLPFAAYLFWLRFEAWRERLPAASRPLPWVPLLAVGLLLVIVVTLGEAFLGGDTAGGTYVPARVEDGKLIPGHIEAAPK
ncbi:DUF6111 family protein [Zavarzinia sp.]|uniref:DUF6111 family protein n=1 Tax=Zavarzinia sp. TaxID=2027920 RepID=UPI0035668A32